MNDKKPDGKKAETQTVVGRPPEAPKAALRRDITKGLEADKKSKNLEK